MGTYEWTASPGQVNMVSPETSHRPMSDSRNRTQCFEEPAFSNGANGYAIKTAKMNGSGREERKIFYDQSLKLPQVVSLHATSYQTLSRCDASLSFSLGG